MKSERRRRLTATAQVSRFFHCASVLTTAVASHTHARTHTRAHTHTHTRHISRRVAPSLLLTRPRAHPNPPSTLFTNSFQAADTQNVCAYVKNLVEEHNMQRTDSDPGMADVKLVAGTLTGSYNTRH
jgi:hypothetical protein